MRTQHEHTNDCTPQNCDMSTSEWLKMHGYAGPEGGWMTTVSGRQFSFINPTIEQISIADIAHHLSNICHWNGASREFFSVAQHSVLVSLICPPNLERWGLMHDASEAYCGDMTRPLKALLPDYKIIERRIMRVIAEKFRLHSEQPPAELKSYDDKILRLESRMYMDPSEVLHDGHGNPVEIPDLTDVERQMVLGNTLACEPKMASTMFMMQFRKLFPEY